MTTATTRVASAAITAMIVMPATFWPTKSAQLEVAV